MDVEVNSPDETENEITSSYEFLPPLKRFKCKDIDSKEPSWHGNVVTTWSQRPCWRYHNVVARLKMRVVPKSVSDVVTTLLADVIKTLPQRCYNVAITLNIDFLAILLQTILISFP